MPKVSAKTIIIGNFMFLAIAIACVIVVEFPFRVADCGPPDPYIIRYLGAPFFYRSGYGLSSSLEAHFWVLPLLGNVIVLAAGAFAFFWVCGRFWPWRVNRIQAILSFIPSLLAILIIWVTIYFIMYENTLRGWVGVLPSQSDVVCTTFWQTGPDMNARQRAP
mgnify:FL=1